MRRLSFKFTTDLDGILLFISFNKTNFIGEHFVVFSLIRIKLHKNNASVYLIGEKKTGHKINRVKLLVGGNFSHLHIKLVTFPQLNFGF